MRKGQPQRRSLKLYFHILITNFIMRVKELLQSVLCRCVIESDLNRIKKAINKYSVISFDILILFYKGKYQLLQMYST